MGFFSKDSTLRPLAVNNVNDKDINKANIRSSLCSCNSEMSPDTTQKQQQTTEADTACQRTEDKQGTFITTSTDFCEIINS